jgi:hypothetical protein
MTGGARAAETLTRRRSAADDAGADARPAGSATLGRAAP